MHNPPPFTDDICTLIRMAVREDMGDPMRDRTVEMSIPQGTAGHATIVSRKAGIISGAFLLERILAEYGAGINVEVVTPDGSRVVANQPVAQLFGPARTILSSERVLLNFLGHLSGIATATRRYVDAIAHLPTPPVICDTRKTMPGFRALDKYAVRCGGGVNHRMGLYDGVMLKDNHLAALRDRLGKSLSLAELTTKIRAELPKEILLWLEVDTLEQLPDALPGGAADIILLDNMPPAQMKQAVAMRDASNANGKPLLEASGGITLDTIKDIAATGVDRISIGALTHSAPVLDLSMEMA